MDDPTRIGALVARHSRSEEFRRALADPIAGCEASWSEVDPDPNAAAVLVRRARTLREAWREPIPDRVSFLEDRCRGRRVLDIGCVAHDVARMDAPNWLHRRLAQVATTCLGVDVLADGVAAMVDRGFEAVVHDLTGGLGPLADSAPFDVIVAGELIEHVASIDMLFATAAASLAPEGQLIVTTPNPYAPHRVRAAQLGIVWENVDHILYAFPSGIAELAERHGLFLAEAATTDGSNRPAPKERLRSIKRLLRGRQWRTVGIATRGEPCVDRVVYGVFGSVVRGMWWPRRRFLGETFMYVVARPSARPLDE